MNGPGAATLTTPGPQTWERESVESDSIPEVTAGPGTWQTFSGVPPGAESSSQGALPALNRAMRRRSAGGVAGPRAVAAAR